MSDYKKVLITRSNVDNYRYFDVRLSQKDRDAYGIDDIDYTLLGIMANKAFLKETKPIYIVRAPHKFSPLYAVQTCYVTVKNPGEDDPIISDKPQGLQSTQSIIDAWWPGDSKEESNTSEESIAKKDDSSEIAWDKFYETWRSIFKNPKIPENVKDFIKDTFLSDSQKERIFSNSNATSEEAEDEFCKNEPFKILITRDNFNTYKGTKVRISNQDRLNNSIPDAEYELIELLKSQEQYIFDQFLVRNRITGLYYVVYDCYFDLDEEPDKDISENVRDFGIIHKELGLPWDKPIKEKDPTNPSYYKDSPIECIEAIELMLGKTGAMHFCIGNALKYIWRWRNKNGKEDLDKAEWYLKRVESYCPVIPYEFEDANRFLWDLHGKYSAEIKNSAF